MGFVWRIFGEGFYLLTLTWTVVDKDEIYHADVDRCNFKSIINLDVASYR